MPKIPFKQRLDFFLFGWIVNWMYPAYYRPKYGYMSYRKLCFHYAIPQFIFRLNPGAKWPVHFTSTVIAPHKISKGILCDPGDNPQIYIQAINGIILGSNVGFGAGVKLLSANHDPNVHSQHINQSPIQIGNDVFIGANSVILPGVQIGNNVIVGAGSVVTKNLPSNVIAVGNPCKVIKEKPPYKESYKTTQFNRKIPHQLEPYLNKSNCNEDCSIP
ncbi:acyltransferase [Flavobacteriaceae bacterium F08102]|nr:acyltransferase [Flavobacteriaceae bacterium F08102]